MYTIKKVVVLNFSIFWICFIKMTYVMWWRLHQIALFLPLLREPLTSSRSFLRISVRPNMMASRICLTASSSMVDIFKRPVEQTRQQKFCWYTAAVPWCSNNTTDQCSRDRFEVRNNYAALAQLLLSPVIPRTAALYQQKKCWRSEVEFPLDTSMFLDNKEHSDEPILALEERRRRGREKSSS